MRRQRLPTSAPAADQDGERFGCRLASVRQQHRCRHRCQQTVRGAGQHAFNPTGVAVGADHDQSDSRSAARESIAPAMSPSVVSTHTSAETPCRVSHRCNASRCRRSAVSSSPGRSGPRDGSRGASRAVSRSGCRPRTGVLIEQDEKAAVSHGGVRLGPGPVFTAGVRRRPAGWRRSNRRPQLRVRCGRAPSSRRGGIRSARGVAGHRRPS